MAAIPSTSVNSTPPGQRTLNELTLGASDTLAYDPGKPGSLLILRNPTGGALSPTITGSTASASIPIPKYGVVSAAAGLAVGSIPAGAARVIPLDSVSLYLDGVITITGGAGLVASFLQP